MASISSTKALCTKRNSNMGDFGTATNFTF